MSHTTNTASGKSAMTYVKMREECEALLRIAGKIESLAKKQNNSFSDDPVFQKLKEEFRAKLQDVLSLSIV